MAETETLGLEEMTTNQLRDKLRAVLSWIQMGKRVGALSSAKSKQKLRADRNAIKAELERRGAQDEE